MEQEFYEVPVLKKYGSMKSIVQGAIGSNGDGISQGGNTFKDADVVGDPEIIDEVFPINNKNDGIFSFGNDPDDPALTLDGNKD